MGNSRNKILILGASSYIGQHLFEKLGPEKAIGTYKNKAIESGVYFDAVSMDLSNVLNNPEAISHAVILLGETNFATCSNEREKSYHLNVISIKKIIDYLKTWKIKPVFASSDYVFDGQQGRYVETDTPDPIIAYGKFKIEVERYLESVSEDYLILRIAKVVGAKIGDGTIFSGWLDDIEQSKVIKCARDQVMSPIFIDDVISGILAVIEKNCRGIFHLCGSQSFSRLELFNLFLSHLKKYMPTDASAIPCNINDIGLPEQYPLNISMLPDKIMNETGLMLRDMHSVCEEFFDQKCFSGLGSP